MRLKFSLILILAWNTCSFASEPDVPLEPRSAIVPASPISPGDESRRDALTRYGVGILRDRAEQLATAAKLYQTAAERDPTAAAPQRELARVYADLGRDPAAIRAARKALELDPKDAETARRLGKLLFDAKQYSDSGKAFRQAADSPNWKDEPAARLAALRDAAKAFQEARDHAATDLACRDALTTIRTARDLLTRPGGYSTEELERMRGDLYERIGTAQLGPGKFDAAATAFETARSIFIDPAANARAAAARVQWNLSSVAMAKGDHAAGLKHVEAFLTLRPSTFEPYQRYAELMRKAGREDDIIPALAKFATDNTKNANIVWLLAAERATSDFDAADAAFRKLATTTTTHDPAAFFVMVRAYADAKRGKALIDLADLVFAGCKPQKDSDTNPGAAAPPEAFERARHLTAAIKGDTAAAKLLVTQLATEFREGTVRDGDKDDEAPTLELVTWLATRDGHTEKLLAGLLATIRRQPTRAMYFITLNLLQQQRKWTEMAELARQARDSAEFRNDLFPYNSEATAQAELGNAIKALDAVDFVVKNVVGKDKLNARLRRARILNILGKHKEAIAECDDIRQEFKKPTFKEQHSIRVILADAYNSSKQFAKAEAELRALLEDDPDDVLVLNNLGYNLADQSRLLEEAEAMIRRAIELDRFDRVKLGNTEPESGVYLDSLAWALFRRGKLADAKELLEKAVTLPDSGPDAVVWDHLGDVRFRLGEKPGARQAWTRAKELYVNSHQGRQGGRMQDVVKKLKLVE